METIYIKTFGDFSITYSDKKISDQDNRSKQLWKLLKYLITFHSKELSQASLIHLLWPNDNLSPSAENALKACVHRLKTLLNSLEYPNAKWILNRQGFYQWNIELPVRIDAIEFEDHYSKASNYMTSKSKRLFHYREAFKLFKGSYLANTKNQTWLEPIVAYYRSIYVNIVREVIPLLQQTHSYEEIIYYCCNAISIEPYDKTLYLYLIQSLCQIGKINEAKEQFEYITQEFKQKYGIHPFQIQPSRILNDFAAF